MRVKKTLKPEFLTAIDSDCIAKLMLATGKSADTFRRWIRDGRVENFAIPAYLNVIAKYLNRKPVELTEEKELINQ